MNVQELPSVDQLAEGLAPSSVRIALRDNPLRRHLIVSRVLGKHIPAQPQTILGASSDLAALVATSIEKYPAGDAGDGEVVVIGFAETATGLSECVAHALDALRSGHSTRYLRVGDEEDLGFSEDHSHAIEHTIVTGVIPRSGYSQVVIVDDELTTGRTAINLIAEIYTIRPTAAFTIACLIDARTPTSAVAMEERCLALGITVTVVALSSISGAVVSETSQGFESLGLARSTESQLLTAQDHEDRAAPLIISTSWPLGLGLGSRQGWGRDDRSMAGELVSGIALEVESALMAVMPGTGDVLVLGTEEFMYVPIILAEALESSVWPGQVWFSSSTRSPGLVLDSPDYGLRNGFSYRIDLPGEPQALRFAYNTAHRPDSVEPFSVILVCCDDTVTALACAAPGSLADKLTSSKARTILLQFTPDVQE
jgi:pyrimidine operon attenuation protein/uracil phosphoribosyltransferase